MAYFLGIDLGTTYTAAAIWQDGRALIARLGSHAATIPSVVLLREDGQVITGEAAERRSLIEPQRVAREFKRRIGDPTPLFLGGTPYSAETLMAKLLRWVVDKVAADEGEPADGIAVSHPANWGDYKKDLLRQAIRLADLEDVALLTEPEAAAIHYASQERVEPGSIVAVYDLGGGTFDSAVLRRTGVGWEILGQPEGVERLGGVDFDAAVLRHVTKSLGESYDDLDPNDPPVLAAVARLRQECVAAKEALTADTDVSIPVLLPSVQSEVRLTRGEFEAMIRPALADSITALDRALRSAALAPEEVSTVLLVGGSSRIPLVAHLVGSSLGRPVAVDAHPKHGVALGAAIVAAQEGQERISTTGAHAVLVDDDPALSAYLAAGSGALSLSLLAGPSTDDLAITPRSLPAIRSDRDHTRSYQVPTLAGGGAGDEPQRPPLAFLAGGAAVLVAVIFGGLVMIGGNHGDSPNTDDPPDASPPTVSGPPGTAAINGQPRPDIEFPDSTLPGETTTLPPGPTTTVPRPTTTAPPVTTTTLPPTTTTVPPTTTTPTTTPETTTTVPPQSQP
jgi:actin-like ATPase involved in cell morphogenesis